MNPFPISCILCLVSLFSFGAPVLQFNLEADGADVWSHKSNSTITVEKDRDNRHSGGILKLATETSEFAYGWANRYLPTADFARSGGIHGYYRGNGTGTVKVYLMLIREGAPPSYFSATLGSLQDSRGEWLEFYTSFSQMTYERGPHKSFTAKQVSEKDKLQFTVLTGHDQKLSVEFASLAFASVEDGAQLAKRIGRQTLQRKLLPENQVDPDSHPRLFFRPDERRKLNGEIAEIPTLGIARKHLLALADRELETRETDTRWQRVLDFREAETLEGHARRGAFEGKLTPSVYPLETLAAAYQLTGEEKYGRRAADLALRMAKVLTVDDSLIDEGFYYTRTFYVRALAFVYDWTFPLLTPQQRRELKTTLLGFVLDIHAKSRTQSWGKSPLKRVWNWDPGLMGAAGIGMLALEGETTTGEKTIIFECRRHLRDYLTLGLDRDGCGHEGPSYLGYGIGGGVQFIELLRRQNRGDLFVESNYQLIPPWLVAETLPGGRRWNNLSDCGSGQAPRPVYSYACGRLAKLAGGEENVPSGKLQSPATSKPEDFLFQFAEYPGSRNLSYKDLAGLASWVWENGPGNRPVEKYNAPNTLAYLLFWRPWKAMGNPGKVLPLGQHFRGRGLVVSRNGFSKDAWHLAIEAGPHVAGHDQSDKGTFTLRAYGGDLVIDSGYGNDSSTEKSTSSYAHNVVLIDGQGQPMRYHNQSSGHITGFYHSLLLDWIRVDARDAWGIRYQGAAGPLTTNPVQRAERSFLYIRENHGIPPYLVVTDDIVKDSREHDYTWQWHIPAGMAFDTTTLPWRSTAQTCDYDTLFAPPEGRCEAEFSFEITRPGEYQLMGLTAAQGLDKGSSDSFFIAMDDGKQLTWDITAATNMTWNWVCDRGMREPSVFTLGKGRHVVILKQREPEAELAKLILVPAGGKLPLLANELPEDGIVRLAKDASMTEFPFTIRKAESRQVSKASLEVFPVRPLGGNITKTAFETTKEGVHPRLHYTVRSQDPRFLMVLLPRREGIPRPNVVAEGDWGVRLVWGDTEDLIRFNRSGKFGGASFIRRRKGEILAQGWLDIPRNGKKTLTVESK